MSNLPPIAPLISLTNVPATDYGYNSRQKRYVQNALMAVDYITQAMCVASGCTDGDKPVSHYHSSSKLSDDYDVVLPQHPLINKDIDKLSKLLPDGAWIAGGAALHAVVSHLHNPGDIDIFFKSSKAFTDTIKILVASGFDYVCNELVKAGCFNGSYQDKDRMQDFINKYYAARFTSPNHLAVHLVRKCWYRSPAHVIDDFDLSICKFAITKDGIITSQRSNDDVNGRRITIDKCYGTYSLMRRLVKYGKEGFESDPVEFIKLAGEDIHGTNADEFYTLDGYMKDVNIGQTLKELIEIYRGNKGFAAQSLNEFIRRYMNEEEHETA